MNTMNIDLHFFFLVFSYVLYKPKKKLNRNEFNRMNSIEMNALMEFNFR